MNLGKETSESVADIPYWKTGPLPVANDKRHHDYRGC